MNIQESIQNQVKSGFNKEEIITNLQSQGYSAQQIEDATREMGAIPSLENIDLEEQKTEADGKSIGMGVLFLILGGTRLAGIRGGVDKLSMLLGVFLVGFGIFRIAMGIRGKR